MSQTLCVIARGDEARIAEAAPRYAVDVVRCRQLFCESIEDMRGVSIPGKEDERASSAAPVQNFELHIRVDCYELSLVPRWIFPLRLLLRQKERGHEK